MRAPGRGHVAAAVRGARCRDDAQTGTRPDMTTQAAVGTPMVRINANIFSHPSYKVGDRPGLYDVPASVNPAPSANPTTELVFM